MYFQIVRLISLTSLISTVTALPNDQIFFQQLSRADNQKLNEERASAVKATFELAWSGYKNFAFPHDELHPVSNNYSDSRNGWGASAVDAFSTALIMQIPEIVDTILEYIPYINFNETAAGNPEISLFETTIRYLGGMLSGNAPSTAILVNITETMKGYDLLKGPLSRLASNHTAVEHVLEQAVHLADNLAFAFDTPTGIPNNNLYFNPARTDGATSNGLATTGTLVLEWVHLSDLTGNTTYASLALRAESYLLSPQPSSSEPWPGLVGTDINITTGIFKNAAGGWVGGDDSFYEYLLKMYIYDSKQFASYRDRWILAADSTIEHLASHPSTRPDLTFLAEFDGTDLIHRSQHLACFDGGSFILGGLVLREKKYIDFGLALVNGCHNTYTSTLTGIGPESFRWVTNDTPSNSSRNPGPPASQSLFYEKAGFYITNSQYILRPEVIESFYYAYRATGDQTYRDWAWNAFVAINASCRVGSGYAELRDVNAVEGGGFVDFMDSFWFAEVLKYSYLIHAEDDEWQVGHGGANEWVYNTEAHPFKVWGPPV